MKKILLLIMVVLGAIGAHAEVSTDIEFKVPTGFKVDTISATKFVFEKDSAFAFIEFIDIPNLDKDKAKSIPDSVFLKVGNLKQIETGMDGKADIINKYCDATRQKYVKVYRHLHSDGIAYIVAENNIDEFAWSDSIDDSYHKGLRWYMIALLIVGAIIFFISAIVMAESFLKNWPKFIVSALLCAVFTVMTGLFLLWEIAFLLLGFFLIIGIASRFGYTIIPI